MTAVLISAQEIRSVMNWERAIQALRDGHRRARPVTKDLLFHSGPHSLFMRAVILPGFGAGVKLASLFPPNVDRPDPLPTEDGVYVVIDEDTKSISYVLDGPELTRWKTAADSALASSILSDVNSKTLLVLGAGPVAPALAEAHMHVRPSIERVLLWNRTQEKLRPIARSLMESGRRIDIVEDLDAAVAKADIISAATGTASPLIKGRLLKAGAHVDLVGGYRPDMREADDDVIAQSRVYVDYRDVAIETTGDICEPIASGLLSRTDIGGDLFDLVRSMPERVCKTTVFKNAGGAHLDLLVAIAAANRLRTKSNIS